MFDGVFERLVRLHLLQELRMGRELMVDMLEFIGRLLRSGEDILAYFLDLAVECSAAELPDIVVNLRGLGGRHARRKETIEQSCYPCIKCPCCHLLFVMEWTSCDPVHSQGSSYCGRVSTPPRHAQIQSMYRGSYPCSLYASGTTQ